jgi:hypothetical protein
MFQSVLLQWAIQKFAEARCLPGRMTRRSSKRKICLSQFSWKCFFRLGSLPLMVARMINRHTHTSERDIKFELQSRTYCWEGLVGDSWIGSLVRTPHTPQKLNTHTHTHLANFQVHLWNKKRAEQKIKPRKM